MSCPYKPNAPLIVVTGHYGSGKTNISVALALEFRSQGKNVTLVDLDIVNPYFRAADATEMLTAQGIRCINPEFANTNVDIPSLSAEIHSVFISAINPENVVIFDVGGDNGAAALGRYNEYFNQLGYEMLFVVNMYRPLTETPEQALNSIVNVEAYARMRCTHIVNNSNLGYETTLEDIEDSFEYAEDVSRISLLPEAFTSAVRSGFSDALEVRNPKKKFFFIPNTTKQLF